MWGKRNTCTLLVGMQASATRSWRLLKKYGGLSSATPPTTGVGEDAGKKEPSYTVGGNVD
jgi:hypothetical protein